MCIRDSMSDKAVSVIRKIPTIMHGGAEQSFIAKEFQNERKKASQRIFRVSALAGETCVFKLFNDICCILNKGAIIHFNHRNDAAPELWKYHF